jgi:hypothetical protein
MHQGRPQARHKTRRPLSPQGGQSIRAGRLVWTAFSQLNVGRCPAQPVELPRVPSAGMGALDNVLCGERSNGSFTVAPKPSNANEGGIQVHVSNYGPSIPASP